MALACLPRYIDFSSPRPSSALHCIGTIIWFPRSLLINMAQVRFTIVSSSRLVMIACLYCSYLLLHEAVCSCLQNSRAQRVAQRVCAAMLCSEPMRLVGLFRVRRNMSRPVIGGPYCITWATGSVSISVEKSVVRSGAMGRVGRRGVNARMMVVCLLV
jgi:hypothetical protein